MLAYSLFTWRDARAPDGARRAVPASRSPLRGGATARASPPGGAAGCSRPLATLPPLLALERLLFRILTLGFVLLTLTLATGVIFSEELFGRALRLNHKTVFAILSCVIFGSCSRDAGATAGAGGARCAGRSPAS